MNITNRFIYRTSSTVFVATPPSSSCIRFFSTVSGFPFSLYENVTSSNKNNNFNNNEDNVASKIGSSIKQALLKRLQPLSTEYFMKDDIPSDNVYVGIDILRSTSNGEHILQQTERIKYQLQKFAGGVSPYDIIASDLKSLDFDLIDAIKTAYPEVSEVAKYFISIPGKRFRPLLSILTNKLLADSFLPEMETPTALYQSRMIEVSEMIHAASLMHDDVLDDASVRRGVTTANKMFGNKKAILGGDFCLARACRISASFGIPEVCERTANIVESLVKGELIQAFGAAGNLESVFQLYLSKTHYKTAALMAEACACGALLGGYSHYVKQFSFDLGNVVGMAFQLCDDLLDFTGSSEMMGKAQLSDVKSGVVTSPVLLSALEYPNELYPVIQRKLSQKGDRELVLKRISESAALERAELLVMLYIQRALQMLQSICSESKSHSVYARGIAALMLKMLTKSY